VSKAVKKREKKEQLAGKINVRNSHFHPLEEAVSRPSLLCAMQLPANQLPFSRWNFDDDWNNDQRVRPRSEEHHRPFNKLNN
jgi:hypothetical protein